MNEPASLTVAAAERVWCLTRETGRMLRIVFSDGAVRYVDFEPWLRRHAGHEAIRPYYPDPGAFASFEVRDGYLMWGDYDLVFPTEDLHTGRIGNGDLPAAPLAPPLSGLSAPPRSPKAKPAASEETAGVRLGDPDET